MQPKAIPIPPRAKIHVGTFTWSPIDKPCASGIIDAMGPIAFATSFAQCANDNNQTAAINGIVNNKFTDSLLFLIFVVFDNLYLDNI